MKIRKARFSGSWYPESPDACEKEIQSFLKHEQTDHVKGKEFFGGIVPHAGWYFSGSIACNVIHCISQGKKPDVIVIFGMHLHPGSLPCLMTYGAWETPFGELEVETGLAEELAGKFRFQIETPEHFTPDNTIELQLPFVKYFFPDVKVLCMGVPPASLTLDIAKAVTEISAGLNLKIKVIGSTDLTHYGHNYGFTPKGTGTKALKWVKEENDRRLINTLISMNPIEIIKQGLENQNACCSGAAAAAAACAKILGAEHAHEIAYATSHDKHPSDSFVGYAGVVFE
ncbi:Radical SAM domain-containing protein [Desulfonema limicola]|uniref:Radical SAM domain-containing protein n=1 Tax=Desulfonema limicola TaxID=45656 RepID=A0A975GK57_9BACT|nr:AmmeMemoRadiSam system protein B [Desulfonema limicola]QTA83473.1 Radical SAM domain-containing protein [Desulfonema limicola]